MVSAQVARLEGNFIAVVSFIIMVMKSGDRPAKMSLTCTYFSACWLLRKIVAPKGLALLMKSTLQNFPK